MVSWWKRLWLWFYTRKRPFTIKEVGQVYCYVKEDKGLSYYFYSNWDIRDEKGWIAPPTKYSREINKIALFMNCYTEIRSSEVPNTFEEWEVRQDLVGRILLMSGEQ